MKNHLEVLDTQEQKRLEIKRKSKRLLIWKVKPFCKVLTDTWIKLFWQNPFFGKIFENTSIQFNHFNLKLESWIRLKVPNRLFSLLRNNGKILRYVSIETNNIFLWQKKIAFIGNFLLLTLISSSSISCRHKPLKLN